MNVHEAISTHSRKLNKHLIRYKELDDRREREIERVLAQCAAGQAYSVDGINEITALINEHATQGISPTRTPVTKEMVQEYVNKIK